MIVGDDFKKYLQNSRPTLFLLLLKYQIAILVVEHIVILLTLKQINYLKVLATVNYSEKLWKDQIASLADLQWRLIQLFAV